MHNKKLILKASLGSMIGGLVGKASNLTLGGGMTAPSPMATVGAAADALNSFLPTPSEYSGDKGAITAGMDAAYDGISDAAMSFPPVGTAVGGIMKAGKLLGNGIKALGGGTDGMTTTDAILGSAFFLLTPMGLINGFGGKKTDTFTKDTEVFGEMGSSYGGSNGLADYGASHSGKKYGLFSSKARNEANDRIHEAARLQNVIRGILTENHNQQMLSASMSDTLNNAYQNKLNGGYQQGLILAARRGGYIITKEDKLKVKQLLKALYGSELKINSNEDDIELELNTYNWPKYISKDEDFMKFVNTLPEEWKEYIEDHEDLYEIWRENGKPKTFSESTDNKTTPMFILDNLGKTIINPEISEKDSDEKADKESDEDKDLSYEDFLMKVEELADNSDLNQELNPESFLKGGQLNVIPEGALHAHKHHLEDVREDLEGDITHKGIPVISISDDGKVEQQAEIERNEIIFNLDVTKLIEELREKYHKAESQKEKDEIAEEAGRILSDSIIEDTDDRTNLMDKIE